MLQFAQTQQQIDVQNCLTVAKSSLCHMGSSNMEYKKSLEWAYLCKDYNPIHMYDLAAKLCGFPRKIAHGNHVVAIALQSLDTCTEGQKMLLCMRVEFWHPIVVPARLNIRVGNSAILPYAILVGSKTVIKELLSLVQTWLVNNPWA